MARAILSAFITSRQIPVLHLIRKNTLRILISHRARKTDWRLASHQGTRRRGRSWPRSTSNAKTILAEIQSNHRLTLDYQARFAQAMPATRRLFTRTSWRTSAPIRPCPATCARSASSSPKKPSSVNLAAIHLQKDRPGRSLRGRRELGRGGAARSSLHGTWLDGPNASCSPPLDSDENLSPLPTRPRAPQVLVVARYRGATDASRIAGCLSRQTYRETVAALRPPRGQGRRRHARGCSPDLRHRRIRRAARRNLPPTIVLFWPEDGDLKPAAIEKLVIALQVTPDHDGVADSAHGSTGLLARAPQ